MTIRFSEEEREWLVTEPLNWHVKDGCPKEIAKSIQEKLDLLKKEHEFYKHRSYKGVLRHGI